MGLVERLMKKTMEGEERWRGLLEKLKARFEGFVEKSYNLLDTSGKGFVDIEDLRNFLNFWEQFPTNNELELLYSRLDRYNELIVAKCDYLQFLENK